MGCVQSAPLEESSRASPEAGKPSLSKQKEMPELKGPPSPVVQDPAPWVEGHKTFVMLKDGQGSAGHDVPINPAAVAGRP